jgi:hypothetical protein
MPRYYLELPEAPAPLPWDPHAGPRSERPDTRYFGGVLSEMERTLNDGELDFYLTWNIDRLPSYGERVVAIVLGDEMGRIPRYADEVRAVFKCYGTRPALGSIGLDAGGFAAVAQWGYRWARWVPGASAHGRRLLGRRLRNESSPSGLFTIPLGTYNQLDLGVVGINERPVDLFFAGSLTHHDAAGRLISAKERARSEMLDAVSHLGQRRPTLRLDIRTTSGFSASANASAETYSRALMDSKVCLAPRGTSPETFRVFEGLRYGCIVVTQRLPRRWFYENAPILCVARWSDLESALEPLLEDPTELARWHFRALAWWRDRCSEAAVGRYMAGALNTL